MPKLLEYGLITNKGYYIITSAVKGNPLLKCVDPELHDHSNLWYSEKNVARTIHLLFMSYEFLLTIFPGFQHYDYHPNNIYLSYDLPDPPCSITIDGKEKIVQAINGISIIDFDMVDYNELHELNLPIDSHHNDMVKFSGLSRTIRTFVCKCFGSSNYVEQLTFMCQKAFTLIYHANTQIPSGDKIPSEWIDIKHIYVISLALIHFNKKLRSDISDTMCLKAKDSIDLNSIYDNYLKGLKPRGEINLDIYDGAITLMKKTCGGKTKRKMYKTKKNKKKMYKTKRKMYSRS